MNVYESMLTCGTKVMTPELRDRLVKQWRECHTVHRGNLGGESPNVPLAFVAFLIQADEEFRSLFLSKEMQHQFTVAVAEARSAFLAALKPSAAAVNMANCFGNAMMVDPPLDDDEEYDGPMPDEDGGN